MRLSVGGDGLSVAPRLTLARSFAVGRRPLRLLGEDPLHPLPHLNRDVAGWRAYRRTIARLLCARSSRSSPKGTPARAAAMANR